MSWILHWNGQDLPRELKELPAGRYVVHAIDDAPDLTPDQEEGLRAAMSSLREGKGRSLADVRGDLVTALK